MKTDRRRAARRLARSLGGDRDSWDERFRRTLDDRENVLVRFVPDTVVARDVSYTR